jgi:serine/threonine protein kinase
MSQPAKLLDLLVEWDEQRRQGREPSAAELCPDDPELQQALERRIRKRQRMMTVLELPQECEAESVALEPLLPTLPGFDIHYILGRGGMGVVFKARHKALDRQVAIKMILTGAAAGPQELKRFRGEAEAVARLQHPGIVQIYEVGEHRGCPYLVLELVDGGSLAQRLGGVPLPPGRAAELICTLAQAVDHAHLQGIVHRDLKPANILLQRPPGSPLHIDRLPLSAVPKIADFGLAKRLDADLGQTRTGAVMGSPSYMAPEQADGLSRDIGRGVDIYALGAILYETLTGRAPFVGETLLDTLDQVRHKEPVPPRQLQPNVPRDLEAICLKCLHKRISDRYASAADLAADLRRFLDGEPIHARSISLLDQMARTLSHAGFDPKFQSWSRTVLTLAPLPFVTHLVGMLTLSGLEWYGYYMVGLTAVLITMVVGIILWSNRRVMLQVPSRERRHLRTVWVSHLISLVAFPLVVFSYAPPRQSTDVFILYPLWMVSAVMTFLALASDAGFFYAIAAACLGGAAGMVLMPAWSPLIVGVFMTINMVAQGIFLRRLGRPR